MTEKLRKCPFCGGEVQAFKDRYGKFAIRCAECNLYFSIEIEDGVELFDGWTAKFDYIDDLTTAWNTRAADENPPLTIEQLKKMEGEPVWIVAHPDWGHWELSMDAEDYFEDKDPDLYGLTMPPTVHDPAGKYGLNVLGWFAYRRKLEEK
ncbi:MAG TPA: hypothetical protein DHU59_08865 [Clostridiales bacterium]|nr:hypothetical protein [Clostridiales bacterium]